MGCCNKVREERPIGRLRYVAGTTVVAGAMGSLLLALEIAAIASPRCRRVLPFYRRYTRDTLESILRKDRLDVAP